jgi:hypothetical protein
MLFACEDIADLNKLADSCRLNTKGCKDIEDKNPQDVKRSLFNEI